MNPPLPPRVPLKKRSGTRTSGASMPKPSTQKKRPK